MNSPRALLLVTHLALSNLVLLACNEGGTSSTDANLAGADASEVDAASPFVTACQESPLAPDECFILSVAGSETAEVEVCPFFCDLDPEGRVGYIRAQSLDNQNYVSLRWQLPEGTSNASIVGKTLRSSDVEDLTSEFHSRLGRYSADSGLLVRVDEYSSFSAKACIYGVTQYEDSIREQTVMLPQPIILNCLGRP